MGQGVWGTGPDRANVSGSRPPPARGCQRLSPQAAGVAAEPSQERRAPAARLLPGRPSACREDAGAFQMTRSPERPQVYLGGKHRLGLRSLSLPIPLNW